MAERSWGMITSGAAFEALATTLVFFEDQAAALFGRRGKDGGQDARSGDGTLVYQAKHHENESAALAIKDALGEAENIEKCRDPAHARYTQWKSVTRWRLVTNAVFNPTDRQVWDKKVVPRFAKLNLKADYWERANLDGLLDKHPEVDRSFFQNEVRAFLSLPEVRERAADEEPFLRRATANTFVGREDEVRSVRAFLNAAQRFLVIHGAGGVGKTRLLLEAGEEIAVEDGWQVLWANVATLSMTGTWFDAIVPERKTVLLVDDPEDPKLLQVLAEQLGPRVGRTAQWKVVLSVPSPRDPVLKYLRGPRMTKQVQELVVKDLATKDAVSMCRELLDGIGENAEHERLATAISKRFSCHPIWMTLAIHLFERHGDWARVPETSENLARAYLKEVVDEQNELDPQAVQAVLRWIALLGPVNRENDVILQSIADRTIGDPAAVHALVARLIKRRALIERGARRRLVELKPDVLRDRLLLDWLTTDVGFGDRPLRPSTAAMNLATEVLEALQTGSAGNVHKAMLIALARSELLLRLSGKSVELLAPVFDGIEKALESISASRRVELIELLEPIAPFRPRLTADLIKALVSKPPPVEHIESPFGTREVGPTNVALQLAWLASHAALGARDDDVLLVLETLCSLVAVEAEIEARTGGLPNDGRRAVGQVKRVLEGGPQFLSNYDGAARTVALRLIDALSTGVPSESQGAVIEAIALPLVSIERMQSWNSNTAFHWRRFVIEPGSEAWTTRAEILARVHALLRDGTLDSASRLLLWKIAVEAHASVNRSGLPQKKRNDGVIEDLFEEILAQYVWTGDQSLANVVNPIADQAVGTAERLGHAVMSLRSWLTYANEKDPARSDEVRLRAIEYVRRIVSVAMTAFADLTSRPRLTDAERDRLQAVAKLLMEVAQELYFGSLAHDAVEKAPDPLVRKRFYHETRDILGKLASLGLPAAAHYLVQTLSSFVDLVDPVDVFLLLGTTVRAGTRGGYQYESLAVAEIVSIVQRYLADFRAIFVDSEECRAALRDILDIFVDAGWSETHRLVYSLDSIFK